MGSRHTKSRIIDTAIQLFNQHGSQTISTNHLAEVLGISPGNLYYHFRNKQEIIRAILERMIAKMDGGWTPLHRPSLENLEDMLSRSFLLLWEYRFFYQERNALLRADPELKQRYQAIRKQRGAEIEGFYQGLAEAGVIQMPDDPLTLASVIKIGWLINDYWLSFLDVEDQPINQTTIQAGINLILQLMRPYLSDRALAELSITRPLPRIMAS